MALLPETGWMYQVYKQAGEEVRHESTITWQLFGLASASNAVLLNAVSSFWREGASHIPSSFKLAPFLLGVFLSWAVAWSIWRSGRYAKTRYQVLKQIENDMAREPWLAVTRLYTRPAYQRPPGPGARFLMIIALILSGIGWLALGWLAGYRWLSVGVLLLTALTILYYLSEWAEEGEEK